MTSRDILKGIISEYVTSSSPYIVAFDIDAGMLTLNCQGAYVRVTVTQMPDGLIILNVGNIRNQRDLDDDVSCQTLLCHDVDSVLPVLRGHIERSFSGTAWGVSSKYVGADADHDTIMRAFKECGNLRENVFPSMSDAIKNVAPLADPLRLMSVSTDDTPVRVSDEYGTYARRKYSARPRYGIDDEILCFVLYHQGNNGDIRTDKVIKLEPIRPHYDEQVAFELHTIANAVEAHGGEVTGIDVHEHDTLAFRKDGVNFRVSRVSDHEYEFDLYCVPTHEGFYLLDEEDWDDFDDRYGYEARFNESIDSKAREFFAEEVSKRLSVIDGMLHRNAIYVDNQFKTRLAPSWFTVDSIDNVPLINSNEEVNGMFHQYRRGGMTLGHLETLDDVSSIHPTYTWHRIAEYPNKDCRIEACIDTVDDTDAIIQMRYTSDDGETWEKWTDEIHMLYA